MRNMRRTDDTSSATQHLSRLQLSKRGEQLVAGETTTTLTEAKRGVQGVTQTVQHGKTVATTVQRAYGTATQTVNGQSRDVQEQTDEAVKTVGTTGARVVGRTAGRTTARGGKQLTETVAKRSLGVARDGRASVRTQRASKAVRGGLLAQQRRKAAQKAAAKGGIDLTRIVGTTAPRLGILTSRWASAAVAMVRTAITALVSAFTGSPVLLIAVTIIGLVMALLAAISWLLPGGVNSAVIVTGTWADPVLGPITSPYGMRVHPITGEYKLHDGTDIGAPNGTPVNAACSGLVTFAGPATAYGDHFVIIDCGGGVFTKYGHMDSHTVSEGDSIGAAQQVGTIGSQGYSTGNHLHFIVEVNGATTDPVPFFGDRGIVLGQTPLDQTAGGDPGGSAKEYARTALNDDAEFLCLDLLWTNESNWNPLADNPTSSAYGIPQALPGEKMASAGDDWRTNPITQVRWGLGYIAERYGTPCKAWAFWQSNDPHWY